MAEPVAGDQASPKAETPALSAEDQRRLHAEINQLLNQRFVVTTTAITVFGAFCALMLPKDGAGQQGAALMLFWGAGFLLAFLFALFLWNRMLTYSQATLARYLLLKKGSTWESDWDKFSKGKLPATATLQTAVFLFLGLLTFLWPLIITHAKELTPPACGAAWLLCGLLVYGLLVCLLSFSNWPPYKQRIEDQWREVLGLPPTDGAAIDGQQAVEPPKPGSDQKP